MKKSDNGKITLFKTGCYRWLVLLDLLQICLNCILKRDLQYNQVTPTFRHWHLRGKKFGLTFQSAADAKTFDVAVEKALNELKTCKCHLCTFPPFSRQKIETISLYNNCSKLRSYAYICLRHSTFTAFIFHFSECSFYRRWWRSLARTLSNLREWTRRLGRP